MTTIAGVHSVGTGVAVARWEGDCDPQTTSLGRLAGTSHESRCQGEHGACEEQPPHSAFPSCSRWLRLAVDIAHICSNTAPNFFSFLNHHAILICSPLVRMTL